MQKFFCGTLDRPHNPRIGMPGRKDGNPTHEIDKAVSIGVPHFHAFSVIHYKWIGARVRGRDDIFVTFDQCLSPGAGQM
jgi:hypothetical protein